MNMIRIAIGGDFCPVGGVANELSSALLSGPELLEGIRDVVRESDLIVLNLECPITESNEPIDKHGPNTKANQSAIRLLSLLGTNLVTLANNHILDFDQKGLADTLELCSKHGIDTVGAGLTLQDARRIYYKQIKGRVLAVISVAENEFASATTKRGGANPLDIISLLEDIREARKTADHVLLILHGGLGFTHYPSPRSVRVLRFLAEQGSTAIIRHHPHRVQGHELWKGAPIFYSLGNFLFDWYTPVKDEGWYEGMLVELVIADDDRCSFTIHPFEQCKVEPGIKLLEGAAREQFTRRYDEWSRAIVDDSALQREWLKTIAARESDYLGQLSLPHPLLVRAARRTGLLRQFRPRGTKRRILANYLRCDAHREALLDILERE